MDIDTLYSNVNLKAKKKSKSAFGGDDDSDDIDYTLIDFTNSGNTQRRPNAVDSEAVTYAAVKIPQPGVSREPVCRDGTESDDVIYYKITQPHRDGLFSQSSAQHNEPLPTQSGHTPAAFMAHSDPFPMTMMTPVRETQQRFFQRPTFLLFLCLLFFTLTLILGVLYSLEENAHAELREEKKSIQSQLIDVKNRLQIERDKGNNLSLEKDTRETQLTKALESLKNLNNTHGRLSTEKLSLQRQLSDVNSNLETEKSRNEQLTREKRAKETELSNLRNQKTNAERLRDQYNTSLSDTQKRLDEQKISNAFFSHIKDSIVVELKEYLAKHLKTGDVEQNKMLNSVLQDLEMGCAIGWRNFTGKCYFFSTENETWIESRDTCQARGGHLVIIDSDKERTFLKDTAPGNSETFYWIGLTDAEKERTWRWVDNKVLAEGHWTITEPDNWTDDNKRPEGEDCARANAKEGLWMDAFCDGKLQYICEATAAVKP